ncbi:MAG: hypothetical protein IJX13_03265, partial [Clostridia bacterium]|nr:hypothetical protein [Clostridia bacterium]
MKMFKRVLAMLLTVVTLLAVLPVSAFADAWLDADANTTQTGNVTNSDVTLTFDAKALLQYLKDKDISGLIAGMDASGLKDIFSKEELFELIPASEFKALIDAVIDDVDPDLIMQYIDIEALLADVDKSALVDLIKKVDNLEDYIIDFGALENYVFDKDDDDALADLVGYIKTDALLEDYAKELMELALQLPADDLAAIVDVDTAIHLDGVDFAAVVNKAYFENVITYRVLVDRYVDDDALHDFIEANYDHLVHDLPDFVHEDVLVGILEGRVSDLEAYVNEDALRALVEAKNARGEISYSTLEEKGILDVDALIALMESGTYADIEDYVIATNAQQLMIDNIDPMDLLGFWVGGIVDGEVDVEAVFNSDELKQKYDISDLMMNGDGVTAAAVKAEELVFDTVSAYSIKVLMEKDIIDATAMFVGANRLFTVAELKAAGALDYDAVLFGDDMGTADPSDDIAPLFGEEKMGELLEAGVFDTTEMHNG